MKTVQKKTVTRVGGFALIEIERSEAKLVIESLSRIAGFAVEIDPRYVYVIAYWVF